MAKAEAKAVREAKAKRAEEIQARRVQLQDDQYTIAKKGFDAIATLIAASDLNYYAGDPEGRQHMADRLAYRLRALATALQCAAAQMYQALTPFPISPDEPEPEDPLQAERDEREQWEWLEFRCKKALEREGLEMPDFGDDPEEPSKNGVVCG
jgi:hypothetical protein